MKEIVILSGGTISPEFLKEQIRGRKPKVICADRGLEAAHQAGIAPDFLLGDFDSVDPKLLEQYQEEISQGKRHCFFQKYPSVKDATDTELALHLAMEQKPDRILIFGATGTRADHFLANIHLLWIPLQKGIEAWILDEYNKIRLVEGIVHLEKKTLFGPNISVLPFGGEVKGLVEEGFFYPLSGITLSPGSSLGISNQLVEETGTISMESGTLVLMETRDIPDLP